MRWSEMVTGHPGRKPFSIAVGVAASRPTAGGYLLGALWFSTDVGGGTLYRCSLNTDGSGAYWQQVAGAVSSGTVTSLTAGSANIVVTPSPITTTGTIDLGNPITVDTILASGGYLGSQSGVTGFYLYITPVNGFTGDRTLTIQPNDADRTIDLSANFTLPADPNADRILFWDDSEGATAYLTAGSGLTIAGTTISASGGSEAAANAVLRANAFY